MYSILPSTTERPPVAHGPDAVDVDVLEALTVVAAHQRHRGVGVGVVDEEDVVIQELLVGDQVHEVRVALTVDVVAGFAIPIRTPD